MIRQSQRRYPGPTGMFALSFVCHLAVFLIILKSQQLREFRLEETPVTYVDMVTLPVASPQEGTPAPAAEPAAPAPPAPQAAPPAAMTLPQPKPPTTPQAKSAPQPAPQKNAKAPAPVQQPAPADEAREFNERMERLAEERRQAAVMDRLRAKSGGRVGMPGGHGTEAGSDYSSYVQSRLKDAFSQVMTSQTKSPQLIATITVGADGRIDYRVEQPSGDPLFDDSVARAVTIAGRTLKPPPGGGQFKRVFRFRPEGVGVR